MTSPNNMQSLALTNSEKEPSRNSTSNTDDADDEMPAITNAMYIAELKQRHAQQIDDLDERNDQRIIDLNQQHAQQINDLDERNDQRIIDLNQQNINLKERNDQRIVNLKEQNDQHIIDLKEQNDQHIIDLKELKERNDQHIIDLKKRDDQHIIDLKERNDQHIIDLKEHIANLQKHHYNHMYFTMVSVFVAILLTTYILIYPVFRLANNTSSQFD
ncbi:hypothetical protein EAF00_009831 [Botryotinia globosa]|nr:hypothetical protein EAF00_009831 [Botryotinia globosa]